MHPTHAEKDVLIVIRNAGERTTDCCRTLCEKMVGPENVRVIREAPFERALTKMCDIAIEHGLPWTFSVDADVLLDSDAVSYLWQTAVTSNPNVFQVQAPIVCKLFRGVRFGMRMYRTAVLPRFREYVPSEGAEHRPETYAVSKLKEEGGETTLLTEPVGIHDFEQYYRDMYRTAYVFGQKFVRRLPELLPAWKDLKTDDPDFQIALRGVYDGLMASGDVVLNPAFYAEQAALAIRELGLEEKQPLAPYELTAEHVAEIIKTTNWPVVDPMLLEMVNVKPKRTVWNRLQRIPGKLARSRTIRGYLGIPPHTPSPTRSRVA